MRITQVSDYFDASTGNPLAVFAKMLPERGNNVVVFSSGIAEKPGKLDDSGLKARIVRFCAFRIGKKAIMPGLFLQLLLEKDLEIVHAHVLGFFSLFACALIKPARRYKLVVTPDFDARNPKASFPKSLLEWLLIKFPLQQADVVLPFTELEKKELHSRFGVPMEKMLVLPIGIDLGMFQKPIKRNYRKELGIEKKFVLLDACFLHPKKNLEMIVKSLSMLPEEIVFVHAGGFPDQEYKKKIELMVKEKSLGKRFFFLGNKNVGEMADAYKSADAFVQAGFNESYCIPIIEAMAAGLPVITTKAGIATTAITEGENGYFFKNPEELCAAVKTLLGNRKLLEKISKANYEKSMQYGWKEIIELLEEKYSRLLNQ